MPTSPRPAKRHGTSGADGFHLEGRERQRCISEAWQQATDSLHKPCKTSKKSALRADISAARLKSTYAVLAVVIVVADGHSPGSTFYLVRTIINARQVRHRFGRTHR